ncbi:MAG: hypothetical protein M1834_003575 [Cirrosporium novae-zelandiae]|nr:MAG: hypothetical protein M1834_003575 [Cirrosporium novae-zelandiae]
MDDRTSILTLSNELLRDILDQIEADPEKLVSIDRRQYLSVESFKPPKPPEQSQAQDVANFRLVCRRFSELGVPHQFARITLRFSRAGFDRLDRICGEERLARHTKKFSYMIPSFYAQGRDRIQDLIDASGATHLNSTVLIRKAQDQDDIIRSGLDLRILKKAMRAFTSLQHVQLLRLQDRADQELLAFMDSQDEPMTQLVDLKWTPACIHATKTVGQALIAAKSSFNRFSAPMMNPQSALELRTHLGPVSFLAERLTCLELHFDAGFDLDDRMRDLSGLCRTIFYAAKGMQAVHLGFPSRLPLNLRLEEVFHNVRWERLRAFGIQAWKLDASEIIDFARRHRKTLKGLRLRDVLLREGSMWKDVLFMLHEEMESLDWVSLRRIDYVQHFDEIHNGTIELPDDPLWGSSESDDEEDIGPYPAADDDYDDITDSDEWSDEAENDYGPGANALALAPDTPASVSWSATSRGSFKIRCPEDLGDDGYEVRYQQRKMWEAWVASNR